MGNLQAIGNASGTLVGVVGNGDAGDAGRAHPSDAQASPVLCGRSQPWGQRVRRLRSSNEVDYDCPRRGLWAEGKGGAGRKLERGQGTVKRISAVYTKVSRRYAGARPETWKMPGWRQNGVRWRLWRNDVIGWRSAKKNHPHAGGFHPTLLLQIS
jgi:hypothetical protein